MNLQGMQDLVGKCGRLRVFDSISTVFVRSALMICDQLDAIDALLLPMAEMRGQTDTRTE